MNMNQTKLLNAVRAVGSALLALGCMVTLIGFFGSHNSAMTAIGIGTIAGAVIIFLMGVFFAATDEVIEKTRIIDKALQ